MPIKASLSMKLLQDSCNVLHSLRVMLHAIAAIAKTEGNESSDAVRGAVKFADARLLEVTFFMETLAASDPPGKN